MSTTTATTTDYRELLLRVIDLQAERIAEYERAGDWRRLYRERLRQQKTVNLFNRLEEEARS